MKDASETKIDVPKMAPLMTYDIKSIIDNEAFKFCYQLNTINIARMRSYVIIAV